MSKNKTRTKDKYRVVYNDTQRIELENEFRLHEYIAIPRKQEIAQKLQLSERQIKIWFQNRRAKKRKQQKRRQPTTTNNNSANNITNCSSNSSQSSSNVDCATTSPSAASLVSHHNEHQVLSVNNQQQVNVLTSGQQQQQHQQQHHLITSYQQTNLATYPTGHSLSTQSLAAAAYKAVGSAGAGSASQPHADYGAHPTANYHANYQAAAAAAASYQSTIVAQHAPSYPDISRVKVSSSPPTNVTGSSQLCYLPSAGNRSQSPENRFAGHGHFHQPISDIAGLSIEAQNQFAASFIDQQHQFSDSASQSVSCEQLAGTNYQLTSAGEQVTTAASLNGDQQLNASHQIQTLHQSANATGAANGSSTPTSNGTATNDSSAPATSSSLPHNQHQYQTSQQQQQQYQHQSQQNQTHHHHPYPHQTHHPHPHAHPHAHPQHHHHPQYSAIQHHHHHHHHSQQHQHQLMIERSKLATSNVAGDQQARASTGSPSEQNLIGPGGEFSNAADTAQLTDKQTLHHHHHQNVANPLTSQMFPSIDPYYNYNGAAVTSAIHRGGNLVGKHALYH